MKEIYCTNHQCPQRQLCKKAIYRPEKTPVHEQDVVGMPCPQFEQVKK
jgi:hypothetical protein